MNMVHCMLLSSDAPKNFWGEALISTCFILNRVPKETVILFPKNVEKGELLTFNSSKSGAA